MTGRPPQGSRTPLPGIDGYRLSRVIGEGGMSTVYLGTQLSLGREVAIKVMRPEALADEVSRRRFENEARTIARLEHPHIVGIYEVGRTGDGLPWYAMPHLARGHVGQRDLRDDHGKVREILRALLSALAFAHARGVIHRDVKAENVLFDEADRPLLADFGIALRRGHGTRVTMTGLAVGSTAYMAPEQARGQQVDQRADLYSVGVLAWEMLAGELPYKADDALAMAIQHTQTPIPKLPPALRHWQRFMDRALAKTARKRFHDAQQMLAALEEVPAEGRTRGAWLGGLAMRAAGGLRRMPGPAWVVIALLVAAGIGLGLRQGEAPTAATMAAPTEASTDATAQAATGPAATTGDAADTAMHAAAPLSPVDELLERVPAQIAAGRLTLPDGDNAAASLLEAWKADRDHPQIPAAGTALMAALGDAAARAITTSRDTEATALLRSAARVQADTRAVPPAALATYRKQVDAALRARAKTAAKKLDRAAALQLVEHAKLAGLPAATIERLRTDAGRLPDLGGRDPGNLDGMVVLVGEPTIAAFSRPVSHAEYSRFAEASGRAAALCRERISLLRVVAPRDWTQPGFEHAPGDPVVCVSWQDAEAYAQWLGRRDGYRYRLARAGEASRLPAQRGERVVSEWRTDCAAGCNRRAATGASWRTGNASRTLDPERGYDDVGFRLVREL